jgi:hypothetical protein
MGRGIGRFIEIDHPRPVCALKKEEGYRSAILAIVYMSETVNGIVYINMNTDLT